MRHTALMVLLVPALLAAGCGSSTKNASTDSSGQASATPSAKNTASSGPVDVKLKEWSISPSATTLNAGKVTITAANDGKMTHEMVILRTDKPASGLGRSSHVSEAGSVGEISNLKAGATGSKTFDLKPGHYVVICNLPGHYMAGMHTDLTVR